MIEFDDRIVFVPHKDAPLVDACLRGDITPERLFEAAVEVVHRDVDDWTEDELSLVRQVALCNLFFFLRYVAAYSGPYSRLTPDLHMEMCNFRQRALEPGTWSAGFVPRATYKSSVWTHGATAWELLRNPDLRVGIFSAILDRSLEFMHSVQRTFDSNELMAFLFPEHCITKRGSRDGRWNDTIAIMPNRTRNFPEPSLKAHTAGGSTQGVHVDLAVFDDIVGDAQLNAARSATADMERIANWFSASLRTLLISQKESRVVLAATRYSIDDPYENVMIDAQTHEGDWQELAIHYPAPHKNGRWKVYYRSALAGNESIFPESYSVEFLAELAKKDHWTYITQYVNNPHSAGNLDFSGYVLNRATLEWVSRERAYVCYQWMGVPRRFALEECDVVVGCDPGASAKRTSAKTSRSGVCAVARTPDDVLVVIVTLRDYVKPSKLFGWLFDVNKKLGPVVRATRVETQGPFKMLDDLLRVEMRKRDEFFNLVCIPAMGDKITSVKLVLEPYLKRDALFVVDECMVDFRAEFDIFPSSAMDLLDSAKIAISGTRLPDGALADEDEDVQDSWASRRVGVTGY